jgi:aspartyl-tRNA(Asn)/glutamyl-tRNA(Gln) amidotransferase subunit C
MSGKIDVAALAKLARLEVSDEELKKLEQEIPAILAFVNQIQQAKVGKDPSTSSGLRNVMRADENSHESGIHTEKLLGAAPSREGDRIAVKQVISRQNAERRT